LTGTQKTISEVFNILKRITMNTKHNETTLSTVDECLKLAKDIENTLTSKAT
jgi:hypothetical protein